MRKNREDWSGDSLGVEDAVFAADRYGVRKDVNVG